VVTKFDFKNTNDILGDVTSLNIKSVIIEHDSKIDARGAYDDPQVIALVNEETGKKLKELSMPNQSSSRASLVHTWTSHCSVINDVQIYYVMLTLTYLATSLAWLLLINKFYDEEV
jgi:hypothetical protein